MGCVYPSVGGCVPLCWRDVQPTPVLQALVGARDREIETEDHASKVEAREESRLQQETEKLERELEAVKEKKNFFEVPPPPTSQLCNEWPLKIPFPIKLFNLTMLMTVILCYA